MKIIALIVAALLLSGCENLSWMQPDCGWVNRVLPVKPSRKDKLTPGTRDQILKANEAHEDNCQ